MQTHVYRPIEADTTIRVLNLEPALHRSDPLVGTIHTRPIEDDSTSPLLVYDCLSYCWGRSGKNSEIACDGQRLRITENLETILRRLRRPTSPFLIWIDAICINQDDPVEKTKQVQKMGAIYERAGEVHIWLGPASEQDQIPSVLSVLREKAILKKRIEVDEQDRDTRIAKVLDVLVKPLAAFLSRPWFTRRWVLQELEFARSATFYCGEYSIAGNWVRDGIATLQAYYGDPSASFVHRSLTPRAIDTLNSISLVNNEKRKPVNTTVLELLWELHENYCEDERDRLFAIYGLIPKRYEMVKMDNSTRVDSSRVQKEVKVLDSACVVDYSMDFVTLYTALTKSEFKKDNGLEILNQVLAFGGLSSRDLNWPSWVPDWTKPRNINRDFFRGSGWELDFEIRSTGIEALPVLETTGTLHRIKASCHDGKLRVATEFLKDQASIYRYYFVQMLLDGIDFSRGFRDQGPFRITTVSDKDMSDWNTATAFGALYQALAKKFYAHGNEYSETAQETPSDAEVERVLHDCCLTQYEIEDQVVFGLAFCDVQDDDVVFHLRPEMDSSSYALLLRPASLGATDPHYRIAGGCLSGINGVPLHLHGNTNHDQILLAQAWRKSYTRRHNVAIL